MQDLSLHIRPGEICAFIGHNGAEMCIRDRPYTLSIIRATISVAVLTYSVMLNCLTTSTS